MRSGLTINNGPNLRSMGLTRSMVNKARYFQEGRACDAVARLLESRRGATRANLRFPERSGHQYRVDLVFDLGSDVIAFEHTGTEPFEGHVKLQAEAERRIKPLVNAVAPRLPPDEDFYLDIPLAGWAALAGKEFERVSGLLSEWMIRIARTLPIAEAGRRIPGPGVQLPGVPFRVQLNRTVRYRGIKIPFHLSFLAGDVEPQRLERMRRTVKDKCSKLAGWKATANAHTVLILEWSDFGITNQHLVASAYLLAESDVENRPDEVYLVAPLDSHWCVYTIRTGDRVWENIEPADRDWDVAAEILQDITGEHTKIGEGPWV